MNASDDTKEITQGRGPGGGGFIWKIETPGGRGGGSFGRLKPQGGRGEAGRKDLLGLDLKGKKRGEGVVG